MFANVRRVFDVFSSLIGLVFLSPLFLLIAAAIKIEDGGKVFYSQPRIGLGFRKFRLLKFRSMVPDAEAMFPITVADDRRITAVGRFIRNYKFDELPQLINVLRGDMALVGSRPELERYVEMFRLEYAELLRDRPGITDPASIAFRDEQRELGKGNVEEEYVSRILPEKLKLSIEYMRDRTFFSDFAILIRTVLGRSLARAGSPREESDLRKRSANRQ